MQLASPTELGTDTGGDVNACIRMRLPPLTPSPAETYSVVRVTSQDQPAVGHPHMLRTPHPQGCPKVPRAGTRPTVSTISFCTTYDQVCKPQLAR